MKKLNIQIFLTNDDTESQNLIDKFCYRYGLPGGTQAEKLEFIENKINEIFLDGAETQYTIEEKQKAKQKFKTDYKDKINKNEGKN